LRDGTQATGVSFTLEDKIKIALNLDDIGVDYIEGGWPGSNKKDEEFFKEIKRYGLNHAKIVAFTSTRRRDTKVWQDHNLEAVLKADVKVATVLGKAWTLHVHEVLRVSKEENLNMIYDTIEFLRKHGVEVIFDAEHFFQGFKEDPHYALQVLKTAEEAGARVLVLADTNGGMMPWDVYEALKAVINSVKTVIGVHTHNDSGCAVANTLMAVYAGARHVQGTINGIGERTGNADLIQIIPALRYKLGMRVLKNDESIKKLKEVSQLVYRITGLQPNPYQPYVGEYAFAHKAGVHVDAVLKNSRAYEHIEPELVGNKRKFIVSELGGAANVIALLKEFGIDMDKRGESVRKVVAKIKELEKQGYSFDKAPASALLIALRELGLYSQKVENYGWTLFSSSTGISVAVFNLGITTSRSVDFDPFIALFKAATDSVKRALNIDENLRVEVSITKFQDNMYRATLTFHSNSHSWSTQGISLNVVEALMKAFIEGFEYLYVLKSLGKAGNLSREGA
jgi:2-isopropylmalate synthase